MKISAQAKPAKIRFFVVPVLAVGLAFACGKKKEEEEGGGESLELTGAAAIVGAWAGNYSARDSEDSQVGDYQSVEMTFFENGKFELAMKDDPSAKANGGWFEFQSTSVFVKVKESTLKNLPKSDGDQELFYDMTGNSLHLWRERKFDLKLARKTTGPGETERDVIGRFEGRWVCSEAGVTTRLSIGGDFQWRGTISSGTSGLGLLAGSGRLISDTSLNLVINSSNYDVKPNSTLTISEVGGTLSLTMNADGAQSSLGPCGRG